MMSILHILYLVKYLWKVSFETKHTIFEYQYYGIADMIIYNVIHNFQIGKKTSKMHDYPIPCIISYLIIMISLYI